MALVLCALVVAEPALAHHEGTPSGVSVVAAQSSVTIPGSIKLTVSADRHLYGTGYSVSVVDEDKGVTLGSCGQPCDLYGGTSWADNANPQPRHFHGELRGPSGGLVATSGQVTVEVRKHTWNIVSVLPTPASRVVPGSIQFVATLDHTTYGTPYSIYIYDLDDAGPPTTCNQYICGRYVNRQWADNISPKPGRVRVEVRNAAGDVASSTVYAEAPFRRFIFTPTLSFWTQTTNGTVLQKASARLAAGDPSLNGTPYQIKIRKADGSQVCSAPQYGCDATVTIGETYRAVVEDSGGRNFGDSGAWTLTPDGPRQEVLDDVDLARVASLFGSSSAVCNALAEYPGSHLMEPPSSLSDQYRVCVTSANAGKTKIDVLRDIATGIGGAAALGGLWYLQREGVRPTPAPGTPWTPDDVKAPRPIPLPLVPQVDKLADTLVRQNPTLTQPIADEIAWQCQWMTAPLGLNARRECSGQPIFVSGNDVPTATDHDIEALAYWPPWVALNYRPAGETPGSRSWYLSEKECADGLDGLSCDEYPFWATMQGGPYAVKRPHLKMISGSDNTSQGGLYGNFVVICHMNSGDAFLGLPLAPELGIPTQTRVCNGH